jgi:hypothetical protein
LRPLTRSSFRRNRGQLATQTQIQTDAVDLIVALGGGWSQSKLPDAAAESAALNLVQGSQ